MSVQVRREGKRGCGFRKPGGLYFIGTGSGRPCGLLPIPLISCPTCGHGIKFSRGWTWVNVAMLASMKPEGCTRPDNKGCGDCPLADAKIEKAGLLWIGEKYYKTPEVWMKEADNMGISRRIKSVPKGFKLGETWVALAHIHAIPAATDRPADSLAPCPEKKAQAAIFRIFQPTAIEYVVTGKEKKTELSAMAKRGITPVKVIPVK